MTRTLAFLAATACAAIAVTSACFAGPGSANFDPRLDFTIAGRPDIGRVDLRLRSSGGHDNMSSSFAVADLIGLDRQMLAGNGGGPIRFALVRDPGRIDCAGMATGTKGSGTCRFAPAPAFATLLASRGIGRPSQEESYALTVVGASRDLVEAIAAARYPAPSIDTLTGLAALKVDRTYIEALARRGYRPAKLDDLVAFKALQISPDYIDGMARSGYGRLDADAIVQFKALGIAPAFVAQMAALGYRDVRADDLVQLKIFNVGPADIRAVRGAGGGLPSVEAVVEHKILGGFQPARH